MVDVQKVNEVIMFGGECSNLETGKVCGMRPLPEHVLFPIWACVTQALHSYSSVLMLSAGHAGLPSVFSGASLQRSVPLQLRQAAMDSGDQPKQVGAGSVCENKELEGS